MTGKFTTFSSLWLIGQMRIHGGRGAGASFMKNDSPKAPLG